MASKPLNKEMREAFVNSVMAHVPKPDFESQINDAAQKVNKKVLPPQVAGLIGTDYAKFLHTEQFYMGPSRSGRYNNHWGSFAVMLVCPENDRDWGDAVSEDSSIQKLVEAALAHDEKIEQTTNSLTAVVKTCRTVDQLKALFPEMEKYIEDEPKSTNLPADANLVAELSKLGWPDKK